MEPNFVTKLAINTPVTKLKRFLSESENLEKIPAEFDKLRGELSGIIAMSGMQSRVDYLSWLTIELSFLLDLFGIEINDNFFAEYVSFLFVNPRTVEEAAALLVEKAVHHIRIFMETGLSKIRVRVQALKAILASKRLRVPEVLNLLETYLQTPPVGSRPFLATTVSWA
jgi:hypothetical protein